MNIHTILKNWNIEITDEKSYIEELCDKNKAYFIDRFPYPIKNCDKANQLLFSYKDVLEGKYSKSEFLNTEKKYRNIFNKFWAYNKTFVEYTPNHCPSQICEFISSLDPEYKKFSCVLEDKNYIDNMVEIKNREELEFWVQIVLRNDIDVTFYFEDYDLLVFSPPVIDVQGFNISLNNKKHLDFVKNIISSEGIYLRG